MTKRIAVISDTHGGHRFGLLVPGVKLQTLLDLDDIKGSSTWTPELTEINKYLYNLYRRLITQCEGVSDLSVIHVGEPCWGAKHPSGVIDTSEATQVEVACHNMRPWYQNKNLRRVRFVSGTDAHEFTENSATILLVKLLQAEYPRVDTQAVHHGLFELDGKLIDAAHHGPYPGSRSWLKGNVALYYLRDRVMRHLMAGKRPPDLFLRGHFHTPVTAVLCEGGNEYRLVIMPSFLMMNNHARRMTQSEYELTNGGMWFDVSDGSMTAPQWVIDKIDLRTREVWD